jgi:hypothetical protein
MEDSAVMLRIKLFEATTRVKVLESTNDDLVQRLQHATEVRGVYTAAL